MDGKRVFQERTNIINWADVVGNSSTVPLSKPRLKRKHTLLYNYPSKAQTLVLFRPVSQGDTLRKMSTAPTSIPVVQVSKVKDESIDSSNESSKKLHIPAAVQHYVPVRQPSPKDHQQTLGDKSLGELRQDYPTEANIEELQLRALKRAMSILNTHIAESKERVVELRSLLAERDIEPALFKSMQRQRWMEEKRQIATDHLSKILEQHLVSPPATSSIVEGERGKLDSVSRSTMNLVMFFESPRQRIPTRRGRIHRSVHLGARPRQENAITVPSVHHHKGIIPLLLKSSPHVPPFLKNRVKSKENDDSTIKAQCTSQASSAQATATSLADLPLIPEIPETPTDFQAHVSGDFADTNGSVLIWRDSPRSREEILSELVVNMPDYVDELLAEFDTHSFTPPTALKAPQGPKTSQPSSPQTPLMVPETPKPQSRLTAPLPIHTSPSRKRISALFSLAEAISPRKNVLLNADSTGRARPLSATTTPPTLPSTSAVSEEPARPFAVSFSALPPSESGGSQEAEYTNNKRTSRLGHRLSFFKRH